MTTPRENLAIRPLIVGSEGLVGSRLAAWCEERYPHTVAATRTEMDVTDRWAMEADITRLTPTVVINCAAMSDLERCESEPELAQRINAEGAGHLAAACRAAGVRLIHLSTDYVFDGTKRGEYDEADSPNPLSVYARTKLEGEEAVLETLVDAVVLRVSFVFGPGRQTFLDALVARARRESGPLPVLDGWISRPTYTEEIVRAIDGMLGGESTGVWHFACAPAASRLDFAREVLRLIGDDPRRAVPLAPESLQLKAARPPYSALSTRRFEAHFGWAPRDWREAAWEYLAQQGKAGAR